MRFTKMNGLGNDYVFLEKRDVETELTAETIRRICDRHFGIGSDGVVVMDKTLDADYGMIIYNQDGSRAELCGNALRCVAKLLSMRMPKKSTFTIQTDAGIKTCDLLNGRIRSTMGKVTIRSEPISVQGQIGYVCSVGNPHFVAFFDDIDTLNERFDRFARTISENRDLFPKRTNVEFCYADGKGNAFLRVYERGTGETLACGTGVTCAYRVGNKLGYFGRNATIMVKGGQMICSVNEKDEVLVTGNADINFTGEIDL